MENLSNEIWKDVIGYEGLYIVNNFGIVKSVKRTVRKINRYKTYTNQPIPEKIKYGTPDKDGYLKIGLWKDNKIKTISIHRIVANAFIPNPYNLPQINHIDENKENNKVSNLEWCTPVYNVNHATGKERRIKSVSKPVLQFDLQGNFIKEYKSIADTKNYGFCFQGVGMCCIGKTTKYKGFIWKYKENNYSIDRICSNTKA